MRWQVITTVFAVQAVVFVQKGQSDLVVKRETFDKIVGNDVIPATNETSKQTYNGCMNQKALFA